MGKKTLPWSVTSPNPDFWRDQFRELSNACKHASSKLASCKREIPGHLSLVSPSPGCGSQKCIPENMILFRLERNRNASFCKALDGEIGKLHITQ